MTEAYAGPRWLRSFFWRCLGRRPLRLRSFSRQMVATAKLRRPRVVVTTGIAPLDRGSVLALRAGGCRVVNYLTDDPWNPAHRAPWFFKALPAYDAVFSPRRANLDDLRSLRGPSIHYLPFAYAPEFHHPPNSLTDEEKQRHHAEIAFIGGADADRVPLMRHLAGAGFKLALWGGYWSRIGGMEHWARGHADEETFRKVVASADMNLCLVRRANRDGHAMRTFELAAVGGCMLVEETAEHRELFGDEDACVRYFTTPDGLVAKAGALLSDPAARLRLASAVRHRICEEGHHTYADRLATLMTPG